MTKASILTNLPDRVDLPTSGTDNLLLNPNFLINQREKTAVVNHADFIRDRWRSGATAGSVFASKGNLNDDIVDIKDVFGDGSCIGYWTLNGTYKEIENKYPTTIYGKERYGDGIFGKALESLPGDVTYLGIDPSIKDDLKDEICISFWYKPNSLTSSSFLFNAGDHACEVSYFESESFTGLPRLNFAIGKNWRWYYLGDIAFDTKTWKHYVAMYNKTTGEWIFYLNGVLRHKAINKSDKDFLVNTDGKKCKLGIFRRFDTGGGSEGQHGTGLISNIRVFNRFLTPEEVTILHNNSRTISYSGVKVKSYYNDIKENNKVVLLKQPIEGRKLFYSNNKKLYLKFDIAADEAGVYSVGIINKVDSDKKETIIKEFKINTANTLERKLIEFDLSKFKNKFTNTRDFQAELFICGFNNGNYKVSGEGIYQGEVYSTDNTSLNSKTEFFIDNVKLGLTTKDFVERPYNLELEECQEYCEVVSVFGTDDGYDSENDTIFATEFKNKRRKPKIIFLNIKYRTKDEDLKSDPKIELITTGNDLPSGFHDCLLDFYGFNSRLNLRKNFIGLLYRFVEKEAYGNIYSDILLDSDY